MALVNNQMALNTVYNYYLTTYAPETKNSSRYDTHKKSELRSIYNSIVKQSKESPLYILDTSDETKQFAVGVKEGAREFSNIISSLSNTDSGDMLNKKAASSSNPDIVSAKYIGSETEDDISFDIGVLQLATPQKNMGFYLKSASEVELASGAYSFDININDTEYEFQFNISSDDTNKSLQERLSSLINRSNIGITSVVSDDGEGRSSLQLTSTATGVNPEKDSLFRISDEHTSKQAGVIDYLGISDISLPATNAIFTLNGSERTAYSNSFTVDKTFEISLNNLSADGEEVTIGLKPDVESMTDNIKQLVNSYNGFLNKALAYSGTNLKTDTLMSDMRRLSNGYRADLDNMGLHFEDDGHINVDESQLAQTLESEDGPSQAGFVRDFASSLMRKSRQISLNPMDYVQKTVVAYKNPGKSFANPYMTSMYSGMMFNSYC